METFYFVVAVITASGAIIGVVDILWDIRGVLGPGTKVTKEKKGNRESLEGNVMVAKWKLVVVAFLVFIALTSSGMGWYQQYRENVGRTTADNIQANIKQWTSNIGLAYTPQTPGPEEFFRCAVNLRDGTTVILNRRKEHPLYLQSGVQLGLGPDQRQALMQLSRNQVATFIAELTLELARSKMSFIVIPDDQTPQGPTMNVRLEVGKTVPIDGFTETSYGSLLDEIYDAELLAKASASLTLQRVSGKEITPQGIAP